MKYALALTLLILSAACNPPPPAPGQALVNKERIDAVLKEYTDKGAPVGISALIYEDGKEAYYGAFGFADKEAGRPMARDTIAQIYSMTKPVTGVALMMLYEEGKFQLDDPLAKYLPEFTDTKVFEGMNERNEPILAPPQRPVTVRDITRHTGGIASGGDKNWVGDMYRYIDPTGWDTSLQEMGPKLARVPLAYQPGTRWLYSASVDIQALLVEKFSGMPFDKFIEERIFKPLGMRDTGYLVSSPEQRARLAAIYELNKDDGTMSRGDPETVYGYNTRNWPMKWGGAGLVSTLDDYMRFARMLLNGGELDSVRLLRPETVQLMATDAMPKEVTDKQWLPTKGQVGFGIDFAVRIAPPKNSKEASGAVGEFFWDGKANTLFWVDPKNNIAAVMFTQYFPPQGLPLHKAFRDAVYHDDPEAYAH
ncbi:MAG TPA: serine hydrolase domain-containing protein [Gammaproteobacteria bacterium]|nr:serine hydrolase domain-containing protein [Gammaproteobacteria bacterium]